MLLDEGDMLRITKKKIYINNYMINTKPFNFTPEVCNPDIYYTVSYGFNNKTGVETYERK